MSDAPQLYNDYGGLQIHHKYNDDGPQLSAPHYGPVTANNNRAGEGKEVVLGSKTILGMRRTTFWLLAILALVVIAAAVGGGVGGSIAVRNAKANAVSNSSPNISPHPSSSPSPSPSPSSTPTTAQDATTALSSSTTTTTTAPAPFTPPTATAIAQIDNRCPVSNIVTSYDLQNRFKCTGSTNLQFGDLSALIAYSVQDCVEACVSMNLIVDAAGGGTKCIAVTLIKDLARSVRNYKGANCFLKGSISGMAADGGVSMLRLCRDSDCSQVVGTADTR